MQKRYQIDKQRAVQQFRRLATETNPDIQMILPLAGIAAMLQEGVGHLMREAGLLLMMGVMEEEIRHVVGERSVPNAGRQANRWGKEQGYCGAFLYKPFKPDALLDTVRTAVARSGL